MSSIYKFAVHAGRVLVNPVSKVKRYKENESRVRWLRPEEENEIRSKFVENSDGWEFDLALNTGMRRGEQFFLEWKNVDMERGILTVRGKTGQRHVVANSSAVAALRELWKATGERQFVSPGNDGKKKRDSRRWLEKAAKDAGVTDFHWHDLRHTFASRLVMNGVDIRTVQELLGHKSIVMTMKYAHLAPDHRQAAVEKMNPRKKFRR
jgi:integrase